jgi:hypothetical protein
MGTLFSDPSIESLYRRLFDTPERRALLGELVAAVLGDDRATTGRSTPRVGWDGRDLGRGERRTPAEMQAVKWWRDAAMVWPVAATASSSYGGGWAPESVVGPPQVFPQYGDLRGAWAPRAVSDGVQWIEVSFPDDAPEATGLRVFETCDPGALFAITDQDEDGDAARLWQRAPVEAGDEARVLEVKFDAPRRLRRVRLWLDTTIGAGWNEIDTVALVTEHPTVEGSVDWRRGRSTRSRASRAKVAVAEVDPAGAAVGEGARLAAEVGVARLRKGAKAWRWPVSARASSSYGGEWAPSATVGPPSVFPQHGDLPGAWAPRAASDGAQWLELTYADDDTAIGEVLVFETNLPGALYAVVATDADGVTETLWQRRPRALKKAAAVLSVRVAQPRALRSLRLWVDTDAVTAWPEIDAVALVPQER